jgi:hypothetical protein
MRRRRSQTQCDKSQRGLLSRRSFLATASVAGTHWTTAVAKRILIFKVRGSRATNGRIDSAVRIGDFVASNWVTKQFNWLVILTG